MRLWVRRADLRDWVDKAQFMQDVYFVNRRDLLRNLSAVCTRKGNDECVKIPLETFTQVKQFLSSRNDRITDSAKLAFEKAIQTLDDMCGDEEEEAVEKGEEEKEEPAKLEKPKGKTKGDGSF